MRQGFEHIGGRCVFTSEWDKYARRTYSANYGVGESEIAGDIWQVPLDAIPEHDVLTGGFPCQPFSLAGVSKKNALGLAHGFACDAQGTLFFRVAEILKVKRPAAFVLENVKNLYSHDQGRTFKVICQVLREELGYSLHHKLVDGKRWTPQHRERIFLVGFREDVGFKWPDEDEWPSLGLVKARSILASNRDVPAKYTLSDRLWEFLQEYRRKHELKGNGFGFSIIGPDDVTRTLSQRYHKDGSEILVRQRGRNPRRLTPRECARLMGYADSFQLVVSDTQLYRQFGNSVVVPAVKSVAEAMEPYISKLLTESGSRPTVVAPLAAGTAILKRKGLQSSSRSSWVEAQVEAALADD